MFAYEIRDGFGYEHLVRVERPDPEPGPGQVLMRVRAVSLNYRDHLMIMGRYNPRQKLPLVPCSDGAGEVLAVGPGVTRVKPGDRVIANFAEDWIAGRPNQERLRSTLGGPRDGMLAEQVVRSEHGLVHAPAHLDFAESASLPCAGLTAWNALTKFAPVQPGQRVLLLGTGGVSIFGLQFAKALGAEVFITSSRAHKLERAQALGADHGLDYLAIPDWGREVRKLTANQGVDVVLEVGGAGTLANSIRATAVGGLIALIGVLAGDQPTPNLTSVFMQGICIQGLLVGNRDEFEAMNRAVSALGIRPVVDRRFGFPEVPEAFAFFSRGDHFGKVVIET
jgi:NADPH:quinone reductase-like Zn-dependent oxidoreductase